MEEFSTDQRKQGERQMEVALVTLGVECLSRKVFGDVGWIHPRTNQEQLTCEMRSQYPDKSVLGMAPVLLSIGNLRGS